MFEQAFAANFIKCPAYSDYPGNTDIAVPIPMGGEGSWGIVENDGRFEDCGPNDLGKGEIINGLGEAMRFAFTDTVDCAPAALWVDGDVKAGGH